MSLIRKATGLLRRQAPLHGRCLACGICCELYGHTLAAAAGDLERWEIEGRTDLLAMAGPGGELWVDPDTGERLDYCPFLERRTAASSVCTIHETKPGLCREYPTPVHGFRCVRGIRLSSRVPNGSRSR